MGEQAVVAYTSARCCEAANAESEITPGPSSGMKLAHSDLRRQVRLWLEPDGCPVTDTTAAIAARKRAILLGKDQGRNHEHTVSGVLAGCILGDEAAKDVKGHKQAGNQVINAAARCSHKIMCMDSHNHAASCLIVYCMCMAQRHPQQQIDLELQ